MCNRTCRMAPLFKSMKQKEQILNWGGLPLKETFSPTRKFRCMFPLKNKFDNTFPYKQSSLFFKSYFPLKKCILIKLYMLPSDGIFSIKTAFIFGNTFFRFFPWGKNKTKKKKREREKRKDRLELKILLLQDRTIYFRLKIVYHDWAFLSEKESLQNYYHFVERCGAVCF